MLPAHAVIYYCPMQQTAPAVLMIRPLNFGFNAGTADSNRMQAAPPQAAAGQIAAAARMEFDGLRQALQSEGVTLCVASDMSKPVCPDAVFPNNWISFHVDGTVVLYPMLAHSRRQERRADIIRQVSEVTGFTERRRLDLTHHEHRGRFLEGTGSLVIDHVRHVAYACRSVRTDAGLVEEWARAMNHDAVIFTATDAGGHPYYHTNVMMWIGERCACVCLEAIDTAERTAVEERLRASGREVIAIDRAAVAAFAGNMLELASWDEALGDSSVLVMSRTAYQALPSETLRRISGCVDSIIAVPVPTIEAAGGGSVRCMMAEIPQMSSVRA